MSARQAAMAFGSSAPSAAYFTGVELPMVGGWTRAYAGRCAMNQRVIGPVVACVAEDHERRAAGMADHFEWWVYAAAPVGGSSMDCGLSTSVEAGAAAALEAAGRIARDILSALEIGGDA